MIHALILAGGIGTRVGAGKPKQFIEIGGKPILIHTLDKFQKHPLIDQIAVVCVEGWEEEVRSYRETYGLSKLESGVTGGRTALESIRRGIESLESAEDDIIVIHDGVRPLVDEKTITNVITDCQRYGGAYRCPDIGCHAA